MKLSKLLPLIAVASVVLYLAAYYAMRSNQPEPTEVGFLENAPHWEQHKFPLLTCMNQGEGTDEDYALLSLITTRINRRLGFVAFEVEPANHVDPNRECHVLISVDDAFEEPDRGYCSTCGGSTTFEYRVERPNPGTYAREYEGTGLTIVSLCNVPILAVRAVALEHQLGHVLGLAHDVGDLQSIMNPALRAPSPQDYPRLRITDHDREAIRQRYTSYPPGTP